MNRSLSRRTLLSLAAVTAAGHTIGRAAAQSGTIHEVAIQGMAFVPAKIAAKVGDRVRWTNMDLAPHTATAKDASWTSPTMKNGEGFTLEVTAQVSGPYKCRFHPQMAGEITVAR